VFEGRPEHLQQVVGQVTGRQVQGVQQEAGWGAVEHRVQYKALEGRHAHVGQPDGPYGGDDLGREPGVLELIQQHQQVHQLLGGLLFGDLPDQVLPEMRSHYIRLDHIRLD